MNYRQRLIDAAEAAEFAAKLDAGIAKEVEKLGYVRVHKGCLEKLKTENARLRAELAAMKAMDAYPNTLRDLNRDASCLDSGCEEGSHKPWCDHYE